MVEHIWTDTNGVGMPCVRLQDIWDENCALPYVVPNSPPPLAVFRLNVAPEHLLQVTSQMALLGSILADGQVTMEDAAQLLAFAYPELAGHPQLASVLEAADQAVRALKDDGRISLLEASTIALTLLSGVPSLTDLAGVARALTRRVLALRKPA